MIDSFQKVESIMNLEHYKNLLSSFDKNKLRTIIHCSKYYLIRYNTISLDPKTGTYLINENSMSVYLFDKETDRVSHVNAMSDISIFDNLWRNKLLELVRIDELECDVSGLVRKEHVYQIPEQVVFLATMMIF